MTPELLCAEQERGDTFIEIIHRTSDTLHQIISNKIQRMDMLHLFGSGLRDILQKPAGGQI